MANLQSRRQLIAIPLLCAGRTDVLIQQILKFNRPGVPAWWLNGKILRRRTFGLGQIRLLNMLTPIFRRVDSWLPLPPLSIIAILRKLEDRTGAYPSNAKTAL